MKPSWKRSLLRFALVFAILAPAAAATPDLIARWLSVQAIALPSGRTMDGNNADWLSATPYIGNTAITTSNATDVEWVWKDKLYDSRDDFSTWGDNRANWDIEQVRITGDATYLYVYVEVDWWHGWNGSNDGTDKFQFNMAIDKEIATSPDGGTSGNNWIGDDSLTGLGRSEQYSDYNLIFDKDGIYSFVSGGASWTKIGNLGTDIVFNQGSGFMEARVKWSDLGLGAVPARLRFTMASARRKNWGSTPDAADKTEGMPSGAGCDMLDAVSFGAYNTTDEWEDELADGSIFSYVDVAFDATGNCSNPTLPSAPANVRCWDGAESRWVTSKDTIHTNNPIIAWDPVAADGDPGDGISGYYIQVSRSPAVNADGFLHSDWATVVGRSPAGAHANNMVVYHNNYTAQNWWGATDTTTGVTNTVGYDTPIFLMGETYFIRIWARDRRGMLGTASAIYVLPIDYPVYHDPYTFEFAAASPSTMRGSREPKENDFVTFYVGVNDPPQRDPRDNFYTSPANDSAPNEILNIVMHIRKFGGGSNWGDATAKVLLGTPSDNGAYRWYLPNVSHSAFGGATDPADTHTFWRTGSSPDAAKTWCSDYGQVNIGNLGGAEVLKLNAAAGDTIEYFFEINCPFEAPGTAHRLTRGTRRFLYAMDVNGITGYRLGEWEQAKNTPFRFVVQKRDLGAVWHNPLSNEVPVVGDSLTMRSPAWPTSAQSVRMYVGAVGSGTMNWQMVWRNVDSGTWSATAFSGPTTAVDALHYYYRHDFGYTGGMVEYYFKTNDNSLFIFANGITDNKDSVYRQSIGNEWDETVPFRFPFTSRVKFTSTGITAKDSHSIVAVLGYKAPQFDAMNENAIGVNGVLDLRSCSTIINGSAFANAFPGTQFATHTHIDSAAPQTLVGRSYFAMLTNLATTITGIRRAFWGPIYPLDYVVTDSSRWNTGSDAYENVPIFTYEEAFSSAVERTISGNHTFAGVSDLKGVVYVTGDATIPSVALTEKCSVIAGGSITVSSGATVTAERLDLCALGGALRIKGNLVIDTGVLFSNSLIAVETGITVRIRKLGTAIAQTMSFDTQSQVAITHPPSVSFAAAKESVLSRATRWVIASLRESRR